MAHIEDYLCNIEVPSFDDEEDDTPKLVVDFLSPTLNTTTPRKREESCDEEENNGADAVSKYSDIFQHEVSSVAHLNPDTPKKISGKSVLPALSTKTMPKISGAKRDESCDEEEEKDGESISKYNYSLQRQMDLMSTDWIEVTVRDFKTGGKVMCKAIKPTTSIQDVRQELLIIAGFTQTHDGCAIIRLADEYTIWTKKNVNGGGGNSKKHPNANQGVAEFDQNIQSSFWGRRKANIKKSRDGDSDERSRCLSALPVEATLAEAYLEMNPPPKSTSRVTKGKKKLVRLVEIRRRLLHSSAAKREPVSVSKEPKDELGKHTRSTGRGANIGDVAVVSPPGSPSKVDGVAVEEQRRKLLLLWDYTTLDDDYENMLIFAQKNTTTRMTTITSESSAEATTTTANSMDSLSSIRSSIDKSGTINVFMPSLPGQEQSSGSSHSPSLFQFEGKELEPGEPTPDYGVLEPVEPPPDCGVLEPVEPPPTHRNSPAYGPPPTIVNYVLVPPRTSFLSMPRRSLSKIAGRFSLARLSSSHGAKKLAKVAEETAGRLKVLKDWQGESPSSFLDAKPHVVVIKGLETWRPSDVRKLMMAKLSNEEELSRRVLLAEDMSRWEGLSLMDGRVVKLDLGGSQPPLQGTTVLGPEIGRLAELQRINLNDNKLSGPLPLLECLGMLANLRRLSVSNNQISGSLKNISVLKHLVDLDLSRNAITGSIPEELGSLRELVSLNLSHNELAGAMPTEMGGLSHLCVLNLSHNNLCGYFGDWVGSMQRLQRLNLGHNQLEGPLPRSLKSLPALEYLHLLYNQFRGDLPMEVLTNLNPGIREILLSYNMFHPSVGSTTNPKGKKEENKKKKAPALLEEDDAKEIEDASQIAAKVAALLEDNKKILEDTFIHCTVAI